MGANYPGLLSKSGRHRLTPYILLAPAAVMLTVILIYPLIRTFFMSFYYWPYLDQKKITFIGLGNYVKLFTEDEAFGSALRFTLGFTAAGVLVTFVLGFLIALVLEQVTFLRGLIRSTMILPYMVAPIAVGNIMRLMWARDFGLVNFVLDLFGIAPVSWLAESGPAFWAVVLSEAWRTTPFVALIILAGLNTIPQELYQAARVDGASRFKVFTRIKFPLLLPSISVALVFETIFKLRVFDIVFTLTGGGPGKATTPLGILIKDTYFRYFQGGYAGAISMVLLAIGGLISIVYIRLLYKEVEY